MRAIVNVNHRDMKGREYNVHEICGRRVTLEYDGESEKILVDFTMREVQIILKNKNVKVLRNQAYRDGQFVNYSEKYGYVIEYEMPNGKVFRNLVKNPFDTNDYTAISEKQYKSKFK